MPIPGTPPSRADLVDHLVRTRIAGDVATPRENNLSHYRKLANGDRNFWLGLELGDRWTDEQDVLAVMAERVGVNDDPEYRFGQDTIDPELTVAGLERMASRLRKAADERVFERYLYVPELPDADMVWRTSGEERLSNFMLWQAAYSEMVFSDVLWPDVDRLAFWAAVEEYARRNRRYGSA